MHGQARSLPPSSGVVPARGSSLLRDSGDFRSIAVPAPAAFSNHGSVVVIGCWLIHHDFAARDLFIVEGNIRGDCEKNRFGRIISAETNGFYYYDRTMVARDDLLNEKVQRAS